MKGMSNLLLYNDKIDPSKLVIDLIDLQKKLTRSELDIQELYKKLNEKKDPIEKALAKYDESYRLFGINLIKKKYIIERMTTEQVVNLISDVDKLSRKERGDIANILRKSNDNIKIISQLISGLSIISNMSFDSIRKASEKMKDIDEELDITLSSIDKNTSQLKQFVYNQYNRKSAEKEKYDLLISRIETLESAPEVFLQNAFLSIKDKLNEDISLLMKNEWEKYNLELRRWKFFSVLSLIGGFVSILMMCLFKFLL